MSSYTSSSSGSHNSTKKSKWDQPPKDAQQQAQNYVLLNNPQQFGTHRSSSFPPFVQSAEYAFSQRNRDTTEVSRKKDDTKDKPNDSEEVLPLEMEELISNIITMFKSKGIFDKFRRECLSDIDTKPAFINLTNRVKSLVDSYLRKSKWNPTMSKVKVRENMRRSMTEARFFDTGVDRIVDQVVNPKINSIFCPLVEEEVYNFMGITKPKNYLDDECDEEREMEADDNHSESTDVYDDYFKPNKEKVVQSSNQSDEKNGYEQRKLGHWIPPLEVGKYPQLESLPSTNGCHSATAAKLEYNILPENVVTQEPLPPGDEYPCSLSENENSVGSSDYGVAHTPEEEYDEDLIREKENRYLNSSECGMGFENVSPYEDVDKGVSVEQSIENDSILEEENDELCKDVSDLTTEEESDTEEESPPFEKIGESPPASPIHGNQTQTVIYKHNPFNGTDHQKKCDFPCENLETNGTAKDASMDSELVDISKGCCIKTAPMMSQCECTNVEEQSLSSERNTQAIPFGDDVADNPVYFLEPIPSLVEKSEFYVQFRHQMKKNGKAPSSTESENLNDKVKA